MDSFVPALLAALLSQATDRPAWLTAILADRYRTPARVAVAAFLALLVGNGIAAAGGALVAPILNPNARALLLAMALLFAGAGALWPVKPPDRLEGWRLGAFGTTALGLFILAFGDRTQFLTLGLAIREPHPAFAAAGAVLGSAAVTTAAAMLGEKGWRALPHRPVAIGIGILFLVVGAVIALAALRLI